MESGSCGCWHENQRCSTICCTEQRVHDTNYDICAYVLLYIIIYIDPACRVIDSLRFQAPQYLLVTPGNTSSDRFFQMAPGVFFGGCTVHYCKKAKMFQCQTSLGLVSGAF